MVCPLMLELSLDAKKTTHAAVSEGCAGLPIGLVNSFCAFSFIVEGISGVQTRNAREEILLVVTVL